MFLYNATFSLSVLFSIWCIFHEFIIVNFSTNFFVNIKIFYFMPTILHLQKVKQFTYGSYSFSAIFCRYTSCLFELSRWQNYVFSDKLTQNEKQYSTEKIQHILFYIIEKSLKFTNKQVACF